MKYKILAKNILFEVPDLTALHSWYSKHWINVFAFFKLNGWMEMVGSQNSASNEALTVKIAKAPLS